MRAFALIAAAAAFGSALAAPRLPSELLTSTAGTHQKLLPTSGATGVSTHLSIANFTQSEFPGTIPAFNGPFSHRLSFPTGTGVSLVTYAAHILTATGTSVTRVVDGTAESNAKDGIVSIVYPAPTSPPFANLTHNGFGTGFPRLSRPTSGAFHHHHPTASGHPPVLPIHGHTMTGTGSPGTVLSGWPVGTHLPSLPKLPSGPLAQGPIMVNGTISWIIPTALPTGKFGTAYARLPTIFATSYKWSNSSVVKHNLTSAAVSSPVSAPSNTSPIFTDIETLAGDNKPSTYLPHFGSPTSTITISQLPTVTGAQNTGMLDRSGTLPSASFRWGWWGP